MKDFKAIGKDVSEAKMIAAENRLREFGERIYVRPGMLALTDDETLAFVESIDEANCGIRDVRGEYHTVMYCDLRLYGAGPDPACYGRYRDPETEELPNDANGYPIRVCSVVFIKSNNGADFGGRVLMIGEQDDIIVEEKDGSLSSVQPNDLIVAYDPWRVAERERDATGEPEYADDETVRVNVGGKTLVLNDGVAPGAIVMVDGPYVARVLQANGEAVMVELIGDSNGAIDPPKVVAWERDDCTVLQRAPIVAAA